MTSGQDVSEYLDTLGLVNHIFQVFGEKKIRGLKKIEGKKRLGAPTPPEDQAICLFAGLLDNPDVPLSPHPLFLYNLAFRISFRS